MQSLRWTRIPSFLLLQTLDKEEIDLQYMAPMWRRYLNTTGTTLSKAGQPIGPVTPSACLSLSSLPIRSPRAVSACCLSRRVFAWRVSIPPHMPPGFIPWSSTCRLRLRLLARPHRVDRLEYLTYVAPSLAVRGEVYLSTLPKHTEL